LSQEHRDKIEGNQIDLSYPINEDGVFKQEVLSQLINVTVDMPSDDSFGFTNFKRTNLGAAIYMSNTFGYSLKSIFEFFHQPVIAKFMDRVLRLKNETFYGKKITDTQAKVMALCETFNLEVYPAEAKFEEDTPEGPQIKVVIYPAVYADRLFDMIGIPVPEDLEMKNKRGEIVGYKPVKLYRVEAELTEWFNEIEKGIDPKLLGGAITPNFKDANIDEQQKSVLAHYYKTLQQAEVTRVANTVLNFDTSIDNNLMKVYDRVDAYLELLEYNLFPKENVDSIASDSVISSLNTSDIMKSFSTKLFPILYSDSAIKIFRFIGGKNKMNSNKDTVYRKATNDYLHSILQNFGIYKGKTLLEYARPYIKGDKVFTVITKAEELIKQLEGEGIQLRLLNILAVDKGKTATNTKLFQGFENGTDDKNQLTDEFRYLLNRTDTQEFARALAIIGLVQSGYSKSPIYFSDIIPEEFLTPIMSEAFRKFQTLNNNSQTWYNSIFATEFINYEAKTLGLGASKREGWRFKDYSIAPERYMVEEKVEITSSKVASDVYKQLPAKTNSGNIKIVSWKELENPVFYIIDGKNLVSTRIPNSPLHFGNPFSSDEKVLKNNPKLIKTSSTKESVEKYIDWILNGTTINGKKVEPERREFILRNLKSGDLKNALILYYKELGEPSHANALDYLINKYDWNNTANTVQVPTTQSDIRGENISSKGSELGKKLTNPYNNLKIMFRGVEYKNSEHAYQTWKSGSFSKEVFDKGNKYEKPGPTELRSKSNPRGNNTYELMVGVLTAKLEQHPELVSEINSKGGLEFLSKSTHNVTGDKYWESTGENNFIKALVEAYQSIKVLPENTQVETNQEQVEIKEGVDYVFEQNPELSSIGTQQEYSQYLDSIFPDSKVKEIVYRGGEKEDKSLFQYWTNNKTEAYMYAKAHITKGGNITERNPIPSIYKVIESIFDNKYGQNIATSIITDESYFINMDENGEYYSNIPEWYIEDAIEKISDEDYVLMKNFTRLGKLYDYVKIESEGDLMKQYDDTNYINNIDEYNKLRKWFDENLDKNAIRNDIGQITTAIINITNPYTDEIRQEDLENNRDAYKNGHDGASLMDGDHFVIKSNTEQVHILGNQQDIEGFKNWTNTQSKPQDDFLTFANKVQKEIEKKVEPVTVPGKTVIVPEGANPSNLSIFETEDKVFLMNNGQQEAYDKITKKVIERLNTKERYNDGDKVMFNNPLDKDYSNIIPKQMWNNMIGIKGQGGVGKTSVLKKIVSGISEEYSKTNKYATLNIMYAAPTHNAVTMLQEALGIDSEGTGTVKTTAALVLRNQTKGSEFAEVGKPDEELLLLKKEKYEDSLEKGYVKPISNADIMVIDESSMLDTKFIQDLLFRFKSENPSKFPIFIFMGDFRQLPPITGERDQSFKEGIISATLFSDTYSDKSSELTQIMRSDNQLFFDIFNSVGDQITEQRVDINQGKSPKAFEWKKYDELTNKSTRNLLVIQEKQVKAMIQDYAQVLTNSNNPYEMFWVHYNKLSNPKTQELFNQIRKEYFTLLGKEVPKEDQIAEGDYVESVLALPIETMSDKELKITQGTVKPRARVKVLSLESKPTSIRKMVTVSALKYLLPDVDVNSQTMVFYNRQENIRMIRTLEENSISVGKYDKITKSQIITITDNEGNSHEVKIPYNIWVQNKEIILGLTTSLNKMFRPSYIGSSHTVQGASIKKIVAGDYNVRINAPHINFRDMESSLYVMLTRTSEKLIIIKPNNIPIENNQSEFVLIESPSQTLPKTESPENNLPCAPIPF
jgi:hypothetical protein